MKYTDIFWKQPLTLAASNTARPAMRKIFGKTIGIILPALCLTVAVSCSDFLKEKPTSTLMDEAAFADEASLEANIYGAMKPFGGQSMYLHEYLQFNEVGGCLSFFPNEGAAGAKNIDEKWYGSFNFTQTSTSSTNSNIYRNHYVIISRCNRILECLPSSPVDEAYKTEIEAEARFLRAVAYFCLVRFYGDTPLLLNSYATDPKDKPRTNYCKVYAQIIDDLDFAESNMRTPERVAEVTPGKNRPNRYAATSFKAAVYLQIGSLLSDIDNQWFDTGKEGRLPDFSALRITDENDAWLLAYNNAVKVIEEGPYSLATNYMQLFRWTEPGDFQLKEGIFVLPNTVEVNQGQICYRTLPQFPEGTANTKKVNRSWGSWRPNRFFFQKWCESYGGPKGSGIYNSGIYIGCNDPRLDISLIHTSTTRQDTGETYNVYPSNDKIKVYNKQYAWPYYRKYLNPAYDNNCGTFNYYFMRLSEVYLIAAEAAASLCSNPSDEWGQKAFRYVEAIHRRARGEMDSGATQSSQPKWNSGRFSTREELIDGVMWERAFELCAEGHDWFDTHRRGAAWFREHYIVPVNDFLDKDEQSAVKVWYTTGRSADGHFPDDIPTIRKGLLFAFPKDELIYNSALTASDQNDFFWL